MRTITRLGGLLLFVAFWVACQDQQPAEAPAYHLSGQADNPVLAPPAWTAERSPLIALTEPALTLTSAPFVGQYWVSDGPYWPEPGLQAYSCVEACAEVFGGQASDYACSTTPDEVNNLAWASSWGSAQHCKNGGAGPVAEDYKVGGPVNCGGPLCYISAYVGDWCGITPTDPPGWPYQSDNYCFLRVIPVDIDIKPGSDPNSINCNNENGVIAVAILTTDDFDAMTVDHTTVTFEGAAETHVDKKSGEPRRHEEDVDGDGDVDLVFHFRYGDTWLTCGALEGVLSGDTFDGVPIEGTDAVRMIDQGGDAH